MKKILFRGGMSPLDNFNMHQMACRDYIGTNVGNFLYLFSGIRTLMTEDTIVETDYYKMKYSDEDIKKINEEFEAYIFMLADAFREDYMEQMRMLTRLIKKLKIPCYLIGVGLRASYDPDLSKKNSFDKDVKEFIKAILEKSTIVGVRGEITGDYLSRLGFVEGKDYMVIGCPSMYMHGNELNVRRPNINSNSKVSFNLDPTMSVKALKFCNNVMKKFDNHYFIPQYIDELRLIYAGFPYNIKRDYYPTTLQNYLYKEDRVRFFINVPTWIEFLRSCDFTIGGRLHGNIASILAGCPCLFIPHDARTRELTMFHKIPNISEKDISEDSDIYELIEKLDYNSLEKVHKENFENYIKFLELNNLNHIYMENHQIKKAPLDNRLQSVKHNNYIKSLVKCTFDEIIERLDKCYPAIDNKNKRLMRQITDLQKKNSELMHNEMLNKKTIKELESKVDKIEQEIKRKNEFLNTKVAKIAMFIDGTKFDDM